MSTLTKEQRAERRAADREFAAQAVEQLRGSQGWKDWLTVRASFRTYSPTNTLLIALQLPTATRVAGFKAWIKLGYCVRKGETALRIWAPVKPSKKQMDAWRDAGGSADEKPRTFFKLTAVFDRSQVAELPPPAEPKPLDPPMRDIEGDDLAEHWDALVQLAAAIDSEVALEEIPGGAHGYYEPKTKRIVIHALLSINARVATLIHEIAHALVRVDKQDADPEMDYDVEELVAESVAFTVTRGLGLDISDAAIPYLTSWSQNTAADALEQVAKLVDRLAGRIEDRLNPDEAI